MTNSTDNPEHIYWFVLSSADTLNFTYNNLTATTNDEYGHQIGIIGGLHLYGLSPGTTYHYRAFATNSTTTVYGANMNFTTAHNWSISLNCYNASNGNSIVNWSIFITNESGSQTYTNLSANNPHLVNLSDGSCPVGTNISFTFSKWSPLWNYTNRTYYMDISLTGNYTLNAYLNFYNGSNLYLLSVIDELDNPVPNARMRILEYINESVGYQNITVLFTDGNGQVAVWLTPGMLYKVIITRTGYETETADYIPSSLIFTYTFRLEFVEVIVPPPYVESEEITFNGYISGTTLYVNYTDNLAETINTTIYIYVINYTTNATSLLDTDARTGNDNFQVTNTVNVSNAHIAILHYNHSTFGYKTHTIYFEGVITPITTQATGETLFNLNYGTNPFGWSNTFMFLFLCGCFFSFGQRGAGIGLIFTGGLLLFINGVIGFNTTLAVAAGGIIPALFIIVGVMVLWRNAKREATT